MAFVIAHGLTNAIGKPSTRAVIDSFARYGGVVALDFRGHGSSDGRSSVGRDEIHDIDAAVLFARSAGYRRVVVVGFSMGAAVALRYAGSPEAELGSGAGSRSGSAAGSTGQRATGSTAGGTPDPTVRTRPDAVVAVSAPSRWYIRSSSPMRRVHWMLEHPLGGWVGRMAGIRLGSPWETLPTTPLELVGRIAPTPLLLVHGDADRYFTPQESLYLHRASPGSELWIVPGMGHAESGIDAGTVDRIADWALAAVNPAQDRAPGTPAAAGP